MGDSLDRAMSLFEISREDDRSTAAHKIRASEHNVDLEAVDVVLQAYVDGVLPKKKTTGSLKGDLQDLQDLRIARHARWADEEDG